MFFRSAEIFAAPVEIREPAEVDGHPFDGSFMALGDGRHKLAVTAAARRAIGKEAGDTVHVRLTQRRS